MAKKKTVIEWLKENDVFSFSALEQHAKIPAGYLSKEIAGKKIMLPKHISKLELALAKYGYR